MVRIRLGGQKGMVMTIWNLCKEFIPSSEIKRRINNKQIKWNNKVVEGIEEVGEISGYWELGDFLFMNAPLPQCLHWFDVKEFFGMESTNVRSLNFLTGYNLLTLSKKEHFVCMI